MCGICEIASTGGAVDPARLAAMSETLLAFTLWHEPHVEGAPREAVPAQALA